MVMRPDADRLIATWLEEEAVASPDYLDETLAVLDRTAQRRWIALRRGLPFERPVIGLSPRAIQLLVTLLLGLAIVAAALLVGSRPRPAPPLGLARNGLIASTDGSGVDLSDPVTGQTRVSIPTGLGRDRDPSFSPDGLLVAFLSQDPSIGQHGGPWHVFVAPSDGSEAPRQVSQLPMWDPQLVAPSWSPDSRRIAYNALDLPTNRIGLIAVAADGAGSDWITEVGSQMAWPAWSPDGRWIVYRAQPDGFGAAQREDATAVMLVRTSGGEPRMLTSVPGRDESFGELSWSPDSTRIAYQRRRSSVLRDYVVATWDIERNVETVVTPGGARGFVPAWSPDGRRLAYLEENEVELPVVVVDETGARTSLGPVLDCALAWSPDGEFLLGYAPGCESRLVLVPLHDPTAVRRIDAEVNIGAVDWQRLAP